MDVTTTESEKASLRHCVCDQGLLTRCDGSARLKQGNTSVLVGVRGPTEVRMNKEIANRATVEVTYKPKVGMPVVKHHALEQLIRSTCEQCILTTLFPRSLISIIVQEEHDDGSFLSCTLNAICLALMDAGVAMAYPMAAVSCALMEDEELVFDPTADQEKEAKATVVTVFDRTCSDIVSCQTTGVFTLPQLDRCMDASKIAAKSIQQFYRSSMETKLSKEAN
ncbi:exosome complex component RRP46-like [Sycon ciliatum]|uniref:exosome complex component RRP46-like n=1 Tax=Sycon ciliatum TaxID=27933 RepID=UPI0031F70A0B